MADADYDWLEENVPAAHARFTLEEQRELLKVIERAQSGTWEDGYAVGWKEGASGVTLADATSNPYCSMYEGTSE